MGALDSDAMSTRLAKFTIGQVVRHRVYPFRGVIFDVDPTFSNTEEYWLSIPEQIRPAKDQTFYPPLRRPGPACRPPPGQPNLRVVPRGPLHASPTDQPLGASFCRERSRRRTS